jgi:hypothetical protein
MKTIGTVLFLLFLALLFFSSKPSEIGFALGGPCDFGFGKSLRDVQEKAIRGYFVEKLPESIDLVSVTCGELFDSRLVATFHISKDEAEQLVSELEATFLSRQNHPTFPDAVKRREMIGPPTHTTHIYHLSGTSNLDMRIVSVSFPKDTNKLSTVVLQGIKF